MMHHEILTFNWLVKFYKIPKKCYTVSNYEVHRYRENNKCESNFKLSCIVRGYNFLRYCRVVMIQKNQIRSNTYCYTCM